ncbi:MAG: hypothetical protein K2K04_01985, partial [Clostridia bacterium]|nr:hypothetical protein [Clostridia bacterium]
MNKKLKIASAAVAVVMAGTMAFGMFGCTGGNDDSGKGSGNGNVIGNTYEDLTLPTAKATTSAEEIVSQLNSKAKLNTHVSNKNNAWQRLKKYSEGTDVTTEGKQQKYTVAESYPATTQLKFDVGDDAARAVSFANGGIISGTVTLPDGKQYTTSSLKPAWAALEKSLNLRVVDAFSKKSDKIKDAAINTTAGGGLGDRDIITDGVETINQYSDKLLDLSNYIEDMPNYAKFLEENPVVRLSLTSNVTNGAMYAAPYFDGNNEFEKYVLVKKHWGE